MRSTFRKLNAGNRKMRWYPPTIQVTNLRNSVSQMIDELILAGTLHDALRKEQQAVNTKESKRSLLEECTTDLEVAYKELAQAKASGNAAEERQAKTSVDDTQQHAAECLGLDREGWAIKLHEIGTDKVRRGYLHYRSVAA